jgi:hypothetical protein
MSNTAAPSRSGKVSTPRALTCCFARWVSLLLLVLSGCQSNSGTKVLQVDFEQEQAGMLLGPESVTDTVAHSGTRAGQMLATTDYGATITKTWADLGSPRQMRIGGWLWLPHSRVHAALVVHVESRDGKTLYYRIQHLHEVVKRYKSWQLVHQTHFLPSNMQPTDQIKIYVWQWDYHHRFYFDDLFVEKLR